MRLWLFVQVEKFEFTITFAYPESKYTQKNRFAVQAEA